jgi:hypothetical protein
MKLHKCLAATIAALAITVHAGEPMTWPDDADGDVLRQLAEVGMDFTKEYEVDFNVDFDKWPPPDAAVKKLKNKYKNIELVAPEGGDVGHIRFQLKHLVTYEWVMAVQRETTDLVRDAGGRCESWGVMGP